MAVRPALVAPLCCLLLLLALAPPASADLTVDTAQGTAAFDVYARGSSNLAAPQNTTIHQFWHGYVLDWNAPSLLPGQELSGYNLYRVPGPSTGGQVQVTHLQPRWTATYDAPGDGTYIYFVTAVLKGPASPESVPGNPVSSPDAGTNYPHCNVVSVFTSAPYYDTHIGCLFPLP